MSVTGMLCVYACMDICTGYACEVFSTAHMQGRACDEVMLAAMNLGLGATYCMHRLHSGMRPRVLQSLPST